MEYTLEDTKLWAELSERTLTKYDLSRVKWLIAQLEATEADNERLKIAIDGHLKSNETEKCGYCLQSEMIDDLEAQLAEARKALNNLKGGSD